MKLKALDSFYSDETKTVAGGQEFEVDSPETAKDLIKRGLAQLLEGEKMEDAPKNKAEPKPENKAEAKPSVKVEQAKKAD